MKNIFIIITFFLLQINIVTANTNVAFIDMDKIVSTSKPGLLLIKQLSEINKKYSKKFSNDANNLKKQETTLISQKNILSEKDFQLKVNNLKSKVKVFNENRNKTNNEFNKLKIDSTNKLIKLINPILIKYSDEKLISMIFQKKYLIIGNTEHDITDEIIKIINKDVRNFKIQ